MNLKYIPVKEKEKSFLADGHRSVYILVALFVFYPLDFLLISQQLLMFYYNLLVDLLEGKHWMAMRRVRTMMMDVDTGVCLANVLK